MLSLLLKKTARTLYFSAKILPRGARETFSLAYLFCRAADSIADTPLVGAEKRLFWVRAFPRIINEADFTSLTALKADAAATTTNEDEKFLLNNLDVCLKEFAALLPAQKELVLEVVKKVCQGMEFDLTKFPSELVLSEQETKDYCSLMGGAPGVFWAKLILMSCRVRADGATFISDGKAIGDALQITNILRDMPQDLKNNRRYISPADKKKWLTWGIENAARAQAFYPAIPKRNSAMRAAVVWPVLWALDTFALLAEEPNILTSARIKISKKTIYLTLLKTPLYLISNKLFQNALNKKINAITL